MAKGKTILLVTHDRDFAQPVSRAVVITDGQIVNDFQNGHHRDPAVEAPIFSLAGRPS